MDSELQQFLHERSERVRLLQERQERELDSFDEESARSGFRYVIYCEYFVTMKKLLKITCTMSL